jgi:hypothetical protein
LAKRKK